MIAELIDGYYQISSGKKILFIAVDDAMTFFTTGIY
jgi:hypothetical protein